MNVRKKTGILSQNIENSWRIALQDILESSWFAHLESFIERETELYEIFPDHDNIFAAFRYTPVDQTRVVIMGQDPYHGEGQAHGLAFSVPDGISVPPSLRNIFKELQRDLGIPPSASGNLTSWARQGVLLLNATLTVRAHAPGSHQGAGWETFTHEVIRFLSSKRSHLVFLLWGTPAGKKSSLIDGSKHLILKAPHPSPLSAYRGFLGCGHFSRTNEYLIANNQSPIDWNLHSNVYHNDMNPVSET